MQFSNPVLYVEPKISNEARHSAIQRIINVLRDDLDPSNGVIESLQRINALVKERAKYANTANTHIGLPRLGFGKYNFEWFLNNTEMFSNATAAFQQKGLEVDTVMLYEVAYGSHCIFLHRLIKDEYKDGVGPLFKLYGEKLFCSPNVVTPSCVYGGFNSRMRVLELMVALQTLAKNNTILDPYKLEAMKDCFIAVYMSGEPELRRRIADGYIPINRSDDEIFTPDQSMNARIEYEMCIYHAYKIMLWLDFWANEGFDISVRTEIEN